MKTVKIVCLQMFLLIVVWPSGAALAQEDWVVRIVNQGLPAVVSIVSLNAKGEKIGLGSGYVVNSNGTIVTNYHVIRGAHQVGVQTRAGDKYRVDGVIDFDREKDFALLKIAAFGLPTATLGNSNQAQIGEAVVAVGNPLGLDGTVSTGIISAVRKLEDFSMLQTTAAVSPGSSGGPLFNRRGEVIGTVTSQLKEGQNLNFALPINYVRGAIQSSSAVRYKLAPLAEAEAKVTAEEKKAELSALIRATFAKYEDPDRRFSLLAFKNWQVERNNSWSSDKSIFYATTTITPEDAQLSQIDGYVSEGIRIQARIPPSGRVWTDRRLETWPEEIAQGVLRANPGFARTDTGVAQVGGLRAQVFTFVGQDKRLAEPEKTVLYAFGTPEAFYTVELIAPTSKLKLLSLLDAMMASFELPAGRAPRR